MPGHFDPIRWEELIVSLTMKRVAKLVRAGEAGDHLDGPPSGVRGLYLVVRHANNASWGLRYQLHGKPHWMGLGSALLGDGVSLDAAREKARAARQQLRDKIDPLAERRKQHTAAAAAALGSITFKEAAKQFHAHHQAGWKNPKHARQVLTTLETYAFPLLGNLSVADIDTPAVLRVLEPHWNEKVVTMSRVRARIESVLGWAAVRGYRPKGDNPARWRQHLDQILPKHSRVATVEHHPAMPYVDVPAFMQRLMAREGTAARALAFAILTAARSNEVLGARWSEIDFKEQVWTVPAERMRKTRREHKVPLTTEAMALLAKLPREADFIFIGARANAPLSKMALSAVLSRMGINNAVPHGFRSSFRTWAAEQTNFAREVAEQCLSHTIANKVERSYQRGSMFTKRRQLMEAWARYCFTPPAMKTAADKKIVSIGGVR